MWNKRDSGANRPQTAPQPDRSPPAATASSPSQFKTAKQGGSTAVIGPSISIKGDVSGEEDLLIEGRVEGEIRLHQHSVTVGRSGRVTADIHGQSIKVEGEVHGNLTGDTEVIILNTGRVEGNIVAPRVALEDGSSFRGSIDMQTPQAKRSAPSQPSKTKADRRDAANAVSKPPQPSEASA